MHMRFLSRGFKNLQWYGMTKRKPPGRVVFVLASCVAESKFIPVGGNPPSSSNIFRLNRKIWADFAIPVRQEKVAAGGVLCYILKCVCGYSLKKARALPLERNHQASAADGLRMYGNRHSLCLPDAGKFDIGGPAVNHIRTALYLLLFALWGFSLDRRIIQRQTLHCLRLTAALMLLWLILRTLKYSFVTGKTAKAYLSHAARG